ncbi:piggyBac transposable element-derived protein 4-like [Clinocottus analis]|uniref:piggyBac transposable element-derived protein 4-like n=1 Tax=Clinocottus analis TaxID=304258 RepID=UPI0035C1683E
MMVKHTKKTKHAFQEKRVRRTVACQSQLPINIKEEDEEEKRGRRTVVSQPPKHIKAEVEVEIEEEAEDEIEKRVRRKVVSQPPKHIHEEVEIEEEEEEEEEEEDKREREWSLAESSDEECDTSSLDSEGDAPFPQGEGDASLNNADRSEGARWNDADDPCGKPPQPAFRPNRPPGPQLAPRASYTALRCFQLFFTNSILKTLTQNTNDYGSMNSGVDDPWIDLKLQDMYSFMSLVVYMGVVNCPALTDYWQRGKLHSFPFPKTVMTCAKFLRICRALHLSNPAVDTANKQKRGTAAFDPFCKIKPLYQEMRNACIRNYHPNQEIAIEERLLPSKPLVELKHDIKNKSCRWGYKMFELVDSRSRYTWDFYIYKKKFRENGGQGLGYDSVMELIDTRSLGTGYELFVDHFFTSPTLFRDLLQRDIWACGTIRTNGVGFPKTQNNSLDSKSPRGSLRWIKSDSLLFIQWRNRRDVNMCSTIHAAHAVDTAQRSVSGEDRQWLLKSVPVPPAAKDYCLYASPSDGETDSYEIPHRTQKWYKMLFYQFMDIAIVNAFLLHGHVAKSKGATPLQQRAFRESLAEELAEAGSRSRARRPTPPVPLPHHRPVHIKGHSTDGRLRCKLCPCKTPVKCSTCDVALCFISGRDCYNDWHVANDM